VRLRRSIVSAIPVLRRIIEVRNFDGLSMRPSTLLLRARRPAGPKHIYQLLKNPVPVHPRKPAQLHFAQPSDFLHPADSGFQPLPALWPRTAAPDQSAPPSPSGHRPIALPMGGLNPCASPLRRHLLKPPHAALRLCPPLTLPRPRTRLPDQPNYRTHKGTEP
jgi:hypothetical protein